MTDTFRSLCAELADALEAWLEDEFIRASDADRQLVARARTALAQPEPDASSSMTQSEQQAVIGWVDQHINTNKAIRSWRDPTRGGLLMAEVHTVQPGTRARAALAQQDSTTDTP